jgi:dihydroorotate dehydrogenase (NAD+) catalytic subunit
MNVGGIELEHPIMLASGIMGMSASSLIRIAHSGASAVVTKSVGLEPREGYPNPSFVSLDVGFLNAMGLPNPSVSVFSEEINSVREEGIVVIASIYGSCEEEFVKVATQLYPNAFELNLSCPHIKGYGAELGSDPERVEHIVASVKDVVDVPVWAKLTPNVADICEIGMAAQKGGADAVVAINTVRAMAIDIESGHPVLGNVIGGLSGKAIKPVGVRCVYELYKEVDIPIIGVGGI